MKKSKFKFKYILYSKILFVLGILLLILSGSRSKRGYSNNKDHVFAGMNNGHTKDTIYSKLKDTLKSTVNIIDTPITVIAEYGVIAVPYNVINQDTVIKTEPEIEKEELYERRD